jgi:hypothetical protein
MRIGFSSIYAWRPHVEHLHYLAGLARDAGHEVRFLTCDADLDTCYTKELRPERSHAMHCARCRIGGLRSFEGRDVHSIGCLADDRVALPAQASEWSRSSASTLGRFESDADFASDGFLALAQRLDGPTRRAYGAAQRWIERERLDALCLFNGRMDATRAVLEAAQTAGVPFVSVERTWFGDGLQLLPGENCLGLRSVDAMMREWRDRPLTHGQALRAASHAASRFLRRNGKEWRAYNLLAKKTDWPVAQARRRLLLVPGSRNEVWGHPDRDGYWPVATAAFDALMDHLRLSPTDVVLRCHPNWSERIGSADGSKAERLYTEWASRRGIHCIASNDPTSTLGLIELSDAIVVCGGSAALEAGLLGKQVIAMAPSIYQQAGFQSDGGSPAELGKLELHTELADTVRTRHAEHIARQTLRFAHTMVYRAPQFVDQVRCISTTHYEYREGGDLMRLPELLSSGVLQADDADYASDTAGEDEVLALIAARDWNTLLEAAPVPVAAPRRTVQRRWLLRPIDSLRDALPRGDL